MATGSSALWYRACAKTVKWWLATGRIPEVLDEINAWSRAAAGWHDWQGAKFARFGDNMRFVAVTDGDKVEAELQFGFSVNTTALATWLL
jgi:L-arabinose isomerase